MRTNRFTSALVSIGLFLDLRMFVRHEIVTRISRSGFFRTPLIVQRHEITSFSSYSPMSVLQFQKRDIWF